MGWFKLWAPSGAFDSRSYGKADCASSIVTPTADVEEIAVPGKNGTVLIPQNRWNNVDRTFSMFISLSDWSTVVGKLQECSSGYYTLEDSWNTGYFYMARLRSCELVNSTPALAQGTVQIVFDCQPVRWLTTGAEWTRLEWTDESNQYDGSYKRCSIVNENKELTQPVSFYFDPETGQSTTDNVLIDVDIQFSMYKWVPLSTLPSGGYFDLYRYTKINISYYNLPDGGYATTDWLNKRFYIDSLTHDIYAKKGSSSPAQYASLFNHVSVLQHYAVDNSPANIWPDIPANNKLVVDVWNKCANAPSPVSFFDIKAKTRECIL